MGMSVQMYGIMGVNTRHEQARGEETKDEHDHQLQRPMDMGGRFNICGCRASRDRRVSFAFDSHCAVVVCTAAVMRICCADSLLEDIIVLLCGGTSDLENTVLEFQGRDLLTKAVVLSLQVSKLRMTHEVIGSLLNRAGVAVLANGEASRGGGAW